MIHTTKHQLKNGATILLLETHQAPVTSINICMRVGSRMETDKEAGICHLIEHMLFKGTKKLKPGEVAQKIEAHGGDVNAYTSFDETVYYCTLSSRHTLKGLEILSDAVLNSTITQTELNREREVVIEEILRGKDSPTKVLSENIFARAFPNHNYGRPIIGYDTTVRGFSQKFVYDFYRRWYVPQNMVIVLAGDFKSDAILKHCKKIFAGIPNKPSPQKKIIREKAQTRTQAFALKNPVTGCNMAMAYHAPQLDHEDIPALDVLSHILGEGESSRLDTNVKEKHGFVNSIYSYVYSPQQPGLIYLGYSLAEKNVPKATRAILNEIEEIQTHRVKHDELIRAKISIKSDAIYEKETVEGLARKYSYFENILKRYDFDEHYYLAIDAVSPEDVLNVAQKYLAPKGLTLGLIHPENSKKKWRSQDLLSLTKTKKKPAAKLKAKPSITHHRLKNGLRLIFKENPNVPTVVIRTAHLAGLRSETRRNNGINSLLTQVWGKSSRSLNAQEMAQATELIAGSIDSYSGRNLAGMKADFLSQKSREGIALFLEAFLHPRWDNNEIKREKEHILEALRRENDALAGLAFKLFLKELYPTHPYGMPMLGNATNVKQFTSNQLKRHYQSILDPKKMVLSVVGDFDTDEMIDQLGPELEGLKRQSGKDKALPIDGTPKQSIRIEKTLDKFQAHIVYGFRGIRLKDNDRYALDVLNNILSGQGGRLFLELRDKMSLAYSVTSLSMEGIEPGYFGVYIGTEGSKVDTAVAGIEQELRKVLAKPVSQAEIQRAQQYMVGSYEIELQRNSMIATQLAFNEVYGMSRDEWQELPNKILKITRDDVYRVAHKILKMDHHVLSIVRPGN